MPRDLVLGSGPSGVAAAAALIARGREVVMLDAGGTMEPGPAALRARMGSLEPQRVDGRGPRRDRCRVASGRKRRNTALRFGFHLPHAGARAALGGVTRMSMPCGPPSPREGSAMAGARPSFPIATRTWTPGRSARAIWRRITPPSRRCCRLRAGRTISRRSSPLMPIRPTAPCRRAPRRFDCSTAFRRKREALRSMGVHFGMASKAVADGCRQCAMCLHGCPYRLIFSADQAVDALVATGGLEYRPGVLASRFEEDGTGVAVHTDGEVVRGDRLFVGCGVLADGLSSPPVRSASPDNGSPSRTARISSCRCCTAGRPAIRRRSLATAWCSSSGS